MHIPRTVWIPLLLTFPVAASVAAQSVLHETVGPTPIIGFGFSLAPAGDVDGDGSDDLWTGAPDPWFLQFQDSEAHLLSGADGSVLRTLVSTDTEESFGWSVASGRDLNGDGVSDVVVGAPHSSASFPGAGRVVAYDGAPGATTAPLYELTGSAQDDGFGTSLAFIDDVDGDGVAELVVGAPGQDVGGGADKGALHVFSGASGAPLTVRLGALAGGELGHAVASAGDVDGDGYVDFLGGAPGAGLAVSGSGLAALFSGRTGATLAIYQGDAAGDRFGQALGAAGDVDGDGTPDVVIGAPGGKYARVLSGAHGTTLLDLTRDLYEGSSFAPPEYEGSFGAAVCGAGDQDGDGLDDVAVGYPRHSSVWLFSGADGEELALHTSAHRTSLLGQQWTVFFGWSLARVEVQAPGATSRPELAVGAPFDFYRAPGEYAEDYDVGSVAVLSPRSDPEWIRDVYAIGSAGDVNLDGFADVALDTGADLVVLSGEDLTQLRVWPGLAVTALAAAGDVDLDGVEDLVVGHPWDGAREGEVRVLSGATGAELHHLFGLAADDLLGMSVAGVGDLNGDGHADFAAGAPGSSHPSDIGGSCHLDAGYVRVYSGADGAVLLHLVGEGLPGWNCDWGPWSEAFGFRVSGLGDWNDDAVPDVAVSAPGGGEFYGGEVRVFSGADGALLREFASSGGEFGVGLSGGADFDVDADGVSDLAVGEQILGYGSQHQTVGSVRVFSGLDGSLLYQRNGTLPARGYSGTIGPGYAVAGLADFDRDGHSDFALGNPAAPGPLGPGEGEVLVFSGRDGSVLASLDGTSSWDYLGYSVVSAGDVDGDGADDLLTLALPTNTPNSGARARLLRGFGRGKTAVKSAPVPSGPR